MTIPQPVVGEAESARVADAAIDDDRPHVRAVGSLVQRIPFEWAKPRKLDSGCLEAVHPLRLERTAAKSIDQKQHAHLGPRALTQVFRHRVGDGTRLTEVQLHRDSSLC
jgi:hypothetical protein